MLLILQTPSCVALTLKVIPLAHYNHYIKTWLKVPLFDPQSHTVIGYANQLL